ALPGQSVRAWDLAATKAIGTRDPDWTAGVRMTKTAEGRFIVDDVVRLRGSPDEVEATIVATASRDGRGVQIRLPQDPGQAGKAQTLYLTRKLAGYRVHAQPVTGDKATRAAPFASQVNIGNVAVVTGAWNRAFLDELSGFPSAMHDDQVDAASDAFAGLIAPAEPARAVNISFMGR
ncbi:MAG: phage terminase large subunit, partial [Rhodospirillales bacterium]|nr:phage terminase large subunit [Rhodospirillales bacterium]